jgi:peptide/nickel transport system substrate-binding protein
MQRHLTLALALALGIAGVAAAQDPPPVHGGSLTAAIVADPPGWDPSASTSQEIPRVVYHNVFEGLVRFDAAGEIVPALATEWQVSDDGLEWTFTLRPGVRFHDGSEFTVDDVIAKFERAMDPDSGHTNPAYYQAIEAVESAQDGAAVTFRLERPSRSLLYNLARPDSIIYPAGSHETQRTRPVGTGPFRFAQYVEGSEVRLERFEDYHQEGLPYLDEVVFRIISDANARFAALQAGDIHFMAQLAPEQYQLADANPDLKASVGAATAEITVAMNNAREPFDDLRVRQAITHAIDKDGIVQGVMFGLGTPIGTHMTPAEAYYVDLTDTYPYDPERARALLAEAGYADGFTIDFELPEPYTIERRSGEVVAQQLREVGITVNLSVVEWGTWIERIFLGADYDMTIIGHSEPRDINVYGNPNYYYRYDNERVRELLEEAEAAGSAEEETAAYQEIARIIAEDAVNVWLFSSPFIVAAQQDVYGFWTDQPTPNLNMVEVYRAP